MQTLIRSKRMGAAARNMLFWPLMGLAVAMLYAGVAPYMWRLDWPAPREEYVGVMPMSERPQLEEPTSLAPVALPPGEEDLGEVAPREKASGEETSDEVAQAPPAPAEQQPRAAAEALARLDSFAPEDAVMPMSGSIVQKSGWYRHPVFADWRMAPGVAIQPDVPGGTVKSAYPGVVTEVIKDDNGAWRVRLAHKDDWETEYGGLAKVAVRPNDVLEQGKPLGQAASDPAEPVTFVLRHNDIAVDPSPYLP